MQILNWFKSLIKKILRGKDGCRGYWVTEKYYYSYWDDDYEYYDYWDCGYNRCLFCCDCLFGNGWKDPRRKV